MSPNMPPPNQYVDEDVFVIIPGWRIVDGRWTYIDMTGKKWTFDGDDPLPFRYFDSEPAS